MLNCLFRNDWFKQLDVDIRGKHLVKTAKNVIGQHALSIDQSFILPVCDLRILPFTKVTPECSLYSVAFTAVILLKENSR